MTDAPVVPTVYGIGHLRPDTYGGYAISRKAGRKDRLMGLLTVREPLIESMEWLRLLKVMFGDCQLFQVTSDGAMGLACNMNITPESLPFIHAFPKEAAPAFNMVLAEYLATPPLIDLELRLNLEIDLWAARCVTDPLGTTPGKPRFLLGNLMVSPRAQEVLAKDASQIDRLLRRHVTADWGAIGPEQRHRNFWAIRRGGLIMSHYEVFEGERIYLVTDAERTRTSFLLPAERTDRATEPVSLLTDSEESEEDETDAQ